MVICKTIETLQYQLLKEKKNNQRIGFVPTMGALHRGHTSLIELGIQQSVFQVCSIFVNPTQFNDPKDFEKYPITLEQDTLLLESTGCKILFLPTVEEMYPNTSITNPKTYQLGFIETILEGSARPGHFIGVCQIVERLLAIIEPNILYLGQKDYQQCMVINKLIDLMGMSSNIELIIGETVREPSGLAMSSRNLRLNELDKQNAAAIFKCLQYIKQQITTLPFEQILENSKQNLMSNGFSTIDYVAICQADSLEPLNIYQPSVKYVALIAANIGGVRLIDNMKLN